MNARIVVVAAASALLLALASCGTTGPCNAATCSTGCCDTSGRCQTGSSSAACGSRGNACTSCSLGTSCSFGSCVGSGAGTSGSGGGTSGTGGGSTSGGSASGGSSGTGGGSTSGGTSGTGGGSTAGGFVTGGGFVTSGGSTAGGFATGGGFVTGGGVVGGGSSGTGGGTGAGGACDIVSNPTCPLGSECVLNSAGSSAGTCIPGDCSLTAQDCSGSNKCIIGSVPDAGVRRLCLPFSLGTGGLQQGTSCTPTAPDPCVRGAQCLSLSGQATCRQFCSPSVQCASGSYCNVAVNFTTGSGPSEIHAVCGPGTTCDPFTQSPCATNQACSLVASGQPPICVPAGSVGVGGSCSSASCARGLQCVGASGCRAFCNPSGSPTCATGSCMALPGTAYGICL